MIDTWFETLSWWQQMLVITGVIFFFMTPLYVIERLDRIIARLERNANLLGQILDKRH